MANTPLMFNQSPWQPALAALFGGLSAAGQPGGWSNFGQGVTQGTQNFQQGQMAQQNMALRAQQIQQQQAEFERQAKADAEAEQRKAMIAKILGGAQPQQPPAPYHVGGAGSGPSNFQPGIQTAGGAAPQSAILSGMSPEQAALFSQYAQIDPEAAFGMGLQQAFATPKDTSTDDQREYQMAVQQGYQGTFFDYLRDLKAAGAGSTKIDVHNPSAPVLGDIPPGMMVTPTPGGGWTMSPVPGGPAAIAAETKKTTQEQNTDVVTTDINRALDQIKESPKTTTGIGGALLSGIPSTTAHNVSELISTVRSNASIDKLQAMRAASPTGGALGNVTEQENKMLADTIGSLDQSQTQDQLEYNLKRVYNTYLDIVHGKGNGPERYQLGKPAGPGTPSEDGWTIIDGIKIRQKP